MQRGSRQFMLLWESFALTSGLRPLLRQGHSWPCSSNKTGRWLAIWVGVDLKSRPSKPS